MSETDHGLFSPSDEVSRTTVVRRASMAPWLLLLLVIAGAVGAGYWVKQKLGEGQADLEASHKANQDLATSLHQSEDARRALEAQVAQLQAQGQGLAAERDSLSQSVQQKEAELNELKGTYGVLEQRLQAEIKKGDIHLTQANGKIRVDLVDKILFDSGQATLSGRGDEVLTRVGAVLAQVKDRQIQVSGHTDDSPISDRLRGTFPSNWELSTARAVNVVRYLSEQAGVPARRLVAAGYGPYEPVASNATPQGRARNRRIEIVLMPPLVEKPATDPAIVNAKRAVAGKTVVASAKKPAKAAAKAPAKAKAKAKKKR